MTMGIAANTAEETPAAEHTITVSGHSDDLIEIGGDFEEEFNTVAQSTDGDRALVAFSDEGIWRITPVKRGLAELNIVQCTEDDGDGDGGSCTDVATLTGVRVEWVALANAYVSNKTPRDDG